MFSLSGLRITARSAVLRKRPIPVLNSSSSSIKGVRYASHGHADEHHHETDTTVYPAASVNTPFFWVFGTGLIGSILAYHYLPPNFFHAEDEEPYITRWIKHNLRVVDPSTNNSSLAAAEVDMAEKKLAFLDIQKPLVKRTMYRQGFEQASPYAVVTGSQADLSDLMIKSNRSDLAEAESL